MAFGHLVSIPRTSTSIATGGNCWKSKKFVDNYCASSISTRASWQPNRNLITKEYSLKYHISKNHLKAIDGGISSTSDDKIQKTYLVNASSAQSHESEPQAHLESQNSFNTIKKALINVIKFSRLYAFIGMQAGTISASIIAAENFSQISSTLFLKGLLQFMVPFFFMFQYIMGVNQLSDVEIDKINKPYLPLASGDYSYKHALIIVTSCLFMSIGLSWMVGSKPLFWTVIINGALMSAYSVNFPLLRWKRSTILTALSNAISMVGSFNIGPFLHMQTFVLKKAATFPRSMLIGSLVMGCFYVIITLSKDLADVEGDKAAGLKTLAIRLGVKQVFWLCVSLIQMAYGIAIAIGASSPVLWSKIVTVLAHLTMIGYVWNHAVNSIDLSSKESLQSFHMFMFKLVTIESILIQFVR
ncbi:hypoxanthine-guanine phosphoribosyltransferase [Stylosanthes scabra]|uniref:Hypoxanthine-guanine phosphoribosyltransferase n=1 Tax=Stylosanthes scabra TaxID=79078 RepID=A0ABU6YNU8_9FABA|nr:hypoxanthine-guanine phosphoribosyltransferase [Stylosanthes scabra]